MATTSFREDSSGRDLVNPATNSVDYLGRATTSTADYLGRPLLYESERRELARALLTH